jgi:disulfide oxidoreductase YuzD
LAKNDRSSVQWLPLPEAHDYAAAASYLRLHFPPEDADNIVKGMQSAVIIGFKAKDLFRASKLSLLGVSNSHVLKDVEKIKAGVPLSPLLVLRRPEGPIIADGYHRLCAVYQYDEDAVVPCRIV